MASPVPRARTNDSKNAAGQHASGPCAQPGLGWRSGARAELRPGAREQFAAWDLNRDGLLETPEIDALMNRHAIRGEEAACLATIKQRERRTPLEEQAGFRVSLAQLEGSEPDIATVQSADPARGSKSPFHYETRYRRNLKILSTLVPRLFAAEQPNFEVMKQGAIGDCYFFAMTGYLAARQPRRIVEMIIPEGTVSYSVHFPDGCVIRVLAPTLAELLVNNSSSSLSDGTWLCVLEKAVGERMRDMTRNAASGTAEATDAMASGGSTAMIIELYTGHKVHAIKLRDPIAAANRLAELRRELPLVLGQRSLASVSMGKQPAEGHARIPGLGYRHAYAILGYSPQTDQVALWNPWGQNFTPKGPEGTRHGFVTVHGVFHVPLATLYDEFSTVHLETRRLSRD